jgi:hypothetical protein
MDVNSKSIPENIPLTQILLPNIWTLYLYDKKLFKKIANRQNFQAKPHKKICSIKTVNDLMYILKLMEIDAPTNINSVNDKIINLDMNDYIIMRDGIEPVWEDPKNSCGGTFSIKMNHKRGYEIWSLFIMYILGETLTSDMYYINGITVSYISNSNHMQSVSNDKYTYIKIWDGKSDRSNEQFINILPLTILEKIQNESLMYSQNKQKKDYDKNIMPKLINNSVRGKEKGGFNNYNRRKK